MIKEFWILVKMLFASTPNEAKAVVRDMKHFPFKGYKAMAWCGCIIHRIGASEVNDITISHETIHLKQARLYGKWWKYYLRYVWEWLKGNPFIHPSQSAYHTIPFEMEAYGNEHKADYTPTKDSLKKYTIKNRKATYREHRKEWREYCKTI